MNLIDKKTYWKRLKSIQEQAIKMEKEQVENAFEVGYENGACVNEGKDIHHGSNYYRKTFKTE